MLLSLLCVHAAHTAHGHLCETRRCTVILLFTVSIRFNFLYPLSCSARLPSHSPSSTRPSSAFTAINLGCELAYGCGERSERGLQ